MRPAAAALAIVTLLAACFGAVMARTDRDGAAAGQAVPSQDEARRSVTQQPAIDKRVRVTLEPVRAPADTGTVALQHVGRLVSFGPRHAAHAIGKPGWTKQLDYIEQELDRHGIAVERDTWTDRKELITFTNLSAVIPGRRSDRIVIGCHHDTKCTTGHPREEHNFEFVGANDGGSGVGLLLALAPVLSASPREATIELVFFDGEESLDWRWNEAARALFGSKRYVRRQRDAQVLGEGSAIAAMILLDMVGRTDLHVQEELYSTAQLRTILYSAAVACGHERSFFQRAEAASDDHYPFLEVGIPAVDLIDLNGNPYWHTPQDTLEHVSAESLQKVADVVLTMLPEVERAFVSGGR